MDAEDGNDAEDDKYLSIDDVIPYIGEFGRFQWILGAMFCSMIFPVAYQVLLMYFVAINPPWKCKQNRTQCIFNGTLSPRNFSRCFLPRNEWVYTMDEESSIVVYFDIYCHDRWLIDMSTSVFFVGSALGSLVIAWISDNHGRKPVVFISMLFVILAGFLSSLSPNIYFFNLCRFVVGFFTAGAYETSLLFAEIVANDYRPLASLMIWCSFPIALCVLGLKAYFIRNWKILSIVCSVPYSYVFLFYFFTPESPRWLRVHGKMTELNEVLVRIASFNKKVIPSNIKIVPFTDEQKNKKVNPLDLFWTRKMALLTMNMGFAELVASMTYYSLTIVASDFGGSMYLNFILVSLTEIPATILCALLCDKIGRKKTSILSIGGTGITCGVLACLFFSEEVKKTRVVVGMISKFLITISFNSLFVWSIELYPSTIRAQGSSVTYLISTVGTTSAPWMVTGLNILHPAGPYICMVIATILCASLLSFLMETKGMETLECNTDYEKDYRGESPEEKPLLKGHTSPPYN